MSKENDVKAAGVKEAGVKQEELDTNHRIIKAYFPRFRPLSQDPDSVLVAQASDRGNELSCATSENDVRAFKT